MTSLAASSSTPDLQDAVRSRYERSFRKELVALKDTVTDELCAAEERKVELKAEAEAERRRREAARIRATRQKQMEQALIYSEQQSQKRFLDQREAKMKVMQKKEANAEGQRQSDAQARQELRLAKAAAHEQIMAAHAADAMAMAMKKREADAAKQAQLRERLAAEREALAERNAQKAADSEAKITRAGEQFVALAASQRAKAAARMTAQEERMAVQQARAEQRMAELRAAAEAKQQALQRAQEVQRQRQERRRSALLSLEAEAEERLEKYRERTAEEQRQQQQKHLLQAAASRSRVEQVMHADAQERLALESRLHERTAKVDSFAIEREETAEETRRTSRRLAIDRAKLANSMRQLRSCPTAKGTTSVLELPRELRDAKDGELHELFERVDPAREGRISLPLVKHALVKLAPPPKPRFGVRPSALAASASAPNLYKPELYGKPDDDETLRERCLAAFDAWDRDGSGTISKRELIAALKVMGLREARTALDIFRGFDVDDDGELTFEEFEKIAEKVLV